MQVVEGGPTMAHEPERPVDAPSEERVDVHEVGRKLSDGRQSPLDRHAGEAGDETRDETRAEAGDEDERGRR
jgi:hypothetical protein